MAVRFRQAKGMKVHVVEAVSGEKFGQQTMDGMYYMRAMVAFCFENYGEKTASEYSSFFESKCANEHGVPIIPLKLYAGSWPPTRGGPAPWKDSLWIAVGPREGRTPCGARCDCNPWPLQSLSGDGRAVR